MSGSFVCAACNRRFVWKPELVGRKARCACGAQLEVPNTAEPRPPRGMSEDKPLPVVPVSARQAPPPLPSMAHRTAAAEAPPFTPAASQITPIVAAPVMGKTRAVGLTLGCIGIVVALISILASGLTASLWRSWSASSTPPQVILPPVLPAPSFAAFSGSITAPEGMAKDVRAQVVSSIQQQFASRGFGMMEAEMLDDILAEAGGRLLQPNGKVQLKLAYRSTAAPDEYQYCVITSSGEIGVGPVSAEFRTTGGDSRILVDRELVRITDSRLSQARPHAAWIEKRLIELRATVPRITDMQAGFLADLMLHHTTDVPRQSHGMEAVDFQLRNPPLCRTQPGNLLHIDFGDNAYDVLSDGRGVDLRKFPQGVDLASSRPATPPSGYVPEFPGDPHLMKRLYVYCLLVVGLAIYLLGASIAAIVRPAMWARLLLPFALLKLGMIGTEVYLTEDFFASVAAYHGPTHQPFNIDAGSGGLITTCVVQFVFPTAILIMYLLKRPSKVETEATAAGFQT